MDVCKMKITVGFVAEERFRGGFFFSLVCSCFLWICVLGRQWSFNLLWGHVLLFRRHVARRWFVEFGSGSAQSLKITPHYPRHVFSSGCLSRTSEGCLRSCGQNFFFCGNVFSSILSCMSEPSFGSDGQLEFCWLLSSSIVLFLFIYGPSATFGRRYFHHRHSGQRSGCSERVKLPG